MNKLFDQEALSLEKVLETNPDDINSGDSQPADPTNLAMSSPSPLPQELLDKIIDNLHHDFETLKQCSLASSLLKLRSQKCLYSTIRLSDMYRIQSLRGLVDVNSTLLENVHELELANFWAWVEGDRHLPFILRMAISLRSLIIRNARYSWSSIHRDTQDALIQAFKSPSLVTLTIHKMYSIPISIFAFDINVTYLALQELTFDAFTDDFPSATSADYSRRAVHTLQIAFSNVSLVQTVIDLPNSFITQIRHLIIHDTGITASLTPSIMTAARHSLESLRILHMPNILLHNWFPYDFSLLPKLKRIEFYVLLDLGAIIQSGYLATIVLASVLNFFIINPTAARIQDLSIRIIPLWTRHSNQDWRTFLNIIATISHWAELDRILDAARGSVSSGPKYIVSLDLGLTQWVRQRYLYELPDHFIWCQPVAEMQVVWRDKIHDMMPLASHRGQLTTDETIYTEVVLD